MSDDSQEPISVPVPDTTAEDEEKAKKDNEREEKVNAIQANTRKEAEYLHQEVRILTADLDKYNAEETAHDADPHKTEQNWPEIKKDWNEIVSKITAYIPIATQAGADLVAAGCTEDAAIVRGCHLSAMNANRALEAAHQGQAADEWTAQYIQVAPVREGIEGMLSTLNG
jgi:hypothetical protein